MLEALNRREWDQGDGDDPGRRVEDELRRRLKQQQAVAQLAIDVSNASDLEEALDITCRCVAETLGTEVAVVERRLGDESSSVVAHAYGLPDSVIGTLNEKGPRQNGSEPDEAIGAVFLAFEGGPATRVPAYLQAAGMRRGISVGIPSGTKVFGIIAAYSARSAEFSEADGAFLELVAGLVGLTQQRLLERRRSLEQQRVFKSMVEATETGLVGTSGDGTITFANPTACRMLGVEEAEGPGLDLLSFVPNRNERDALVRAIRYPYVRAAVELRFRRPDGSLFWAHVHTVPFSDPTAPHGRALTSIMDIDDRRSLEEQVRRSQKMEAVGRLAGGVAHDFNNLLTVIRGNAELLYRQADPEAATDAAYLAEIIEAADRAASVTGQMLAISRQKVARVETVVLNDSVSGFQRILRRLLDATFELHLDLAADLRPVLVDPGHVEQILLNLVVNARDAMPDGGSIWLRTSNYTVDEAGTGLPRDLGPGDYAVLEVIDQGTGIPEALVERVFEPFFTTRPEGEGTGLGLSIVYGLVSQNGGQIEVAETGPAGTTLRVFLPATRIETRRAAAPVESLEGQGGTVLVVEDEAALRKLAHEMLAELGFICLTAANGREALEICANRELEIDCVLTDMVMPKMGGLELLSALAEERPELPVALMTGYSDLADPSAKPGVEVLEKPFDLTTLARTLRTVLDAER